MKTISVSNFLYPDQACSSVGPDRSPSCLQLKSQMAAEELPSFCHRRFVLPFTELFIYNDSLF